MNFNDHFVITVSREMGSGGHTIARKLSEKLGVRFFDKQAMQQMMQQFGLSVYEIERIKSRKKSWLNDLLDNIAPVSRGEVFMQSSPNSEAVPVTAREIAEAEKQILSELAAEGSCVIAGRAGFSILKDHPNSLHVFIRSSREKRIERVVAKQGVTPEQAAILLDSVDESRENYVKRISGFSRYDIRNYDLTFNVDDLTDDQAVDVIIKFASRD